MYYSTPPCFPGFKRIELGGVAKGIVNISGPGLITSVVNILRSEQRNGDGGQLGSIVNITFEYAFMKVYGF